MYRLINESIGIAGARLGQITVHIILELQSSIQTVKAMQSSILKSVSKTSKILKQLFLESRVG